MMFTAWFSRFFAPPRRQTVLRFRPVAEALENRTLFHVQTQLHVAPWGSDGNTGTDPEQPLQTLQQAQAVVRTLNSNMTGDIEVFLHGGTYPLTTPLSLSTVDSGTNGHDVIWQAYGSETPVISGGRQIVGWTLENATKNIWQAPADNLLFRQLYVNGERAVRAHSAKGIPGTVVKTATGYTTTNVSLQNFRRPGDLEFVYSGPKAFAGAQWIEDRIGVEQISGTSRSSTITMSSTAWYTATHRRSVKQRVVQPTYLENAYEYLRNPGDWYLDRTADTVYYIPRVGETMASAEVIVPTLQTLVQGIGDSNATPLHNVQFKGITFAYAGWLEPTLEGGFVNLQADWRLNANLEPVRTPANVVFQAAQSVRLEGNVFIHLGGTGLDLYGGSQNNFIVGNTFTDISASGLQIGDIADPVRADPLTQDVHNVISNNRVFSVAREYRGGIGIWLGYVAYTTVSNNEVSKIPYTGISLGWGWGADSYMSNNLVSANNIHHYMLRLGDGGGIYTLGAQPDSRIAGNWIHDTRLPASYLGAAIYHDQGSAYFEVKHNVIVRAPLWYMVHKGHDIRLSRNYTTTTSFKNAGGTRIAVVNISYFSNSSRPNVVNTIMNNAGLQ